MFLVISTTSVLTRRGVFRWKLTLQPGVWGALPSPGDKYGGAGGRGCRELMHSTAALTSCLPLGTAEPQNSPDSPFSRPPVGPLGMSLWPVTPRLILFTDPSHMWLQPNAQPPTPGMQSRASGANLCPRRGQEMPGAPAFMPFTCCGSKRCRLSKCIYVPSQCCIKMLI